METQSILREFSLRWNHWFLLPIHEIFDPKILYNYTCFFSVFFDTYSFDAIIIRLSVYIHVIVCGRLSFLWIVLQCLYCSVSQLSAEYATVIVNLHNIRTSLISSMLEQRQHCRPFVVVLLVCLRNPSIQYHVKGHRIHKRWMFQANKRALAPNRISRFSSPTTFSR